MINILIIDFFRIDWDNLIFRSESFNPQVDFTADYKLDGKILLIPLRGEGRCNISMRKYYNIFSQLHSILYLIYLPSKSISDDLLIVLNFKIEFKI